MPSQTITDQLADSAQQQLAGLREALESRLATLEEVLGDPSRGESLAGLILDLSRVATDEAQAAAAHACLAIKAEADKETTELRTSAKNAVDAAQTALRTAHTSLEQERAVGADLRRAADKAHQEIQKQAELLAAREKLEITLKSGRDQLESEVARQKAIAADLQRATADAQKQVETERASARKVHDKVAAELTHAREALTGRERAQAELQTALDAERAVVAGARGANARAETRVATLEDEQKAARAAHEAVVADAVREASLRERAYAEVKTRLEAELAAAAELQSQLKMERASATELHSQLQMERASGAELHSQIDAERASAAELHSQLEAERASGSELHSQLEAERASAAELRLAAGRATERVTELGATLGRETSEGRAAHDELSSELARQRDLTAQFQKELADGHLALAAARTDLEIERTSSAGLRQAVEDADQQLATARNNDTQTLANLERVMGELDRLRADAASAAAAPGAGGLGDPGNSVHWELAAEGTDLQAERASNAELRQALEFADHQLASARSSETQTLADHAQLAAELNGLRAERDAVAEELQATRKWIDDLHEAEAEFASSTAASPPDATPASAPSSKPKTTASDEGDGWQAVRLASRYVFREEVAVQINGDPGRLFDLSITGCQLLSPIALKPNHTVKVTLPDKKKPVICVGTVVWTRLEPSKGGQAIRYRAGVRFTKADELAIETFLSHHGATA